MNSLNRGIIAGVYLSRLHRGYTYEEAAERVGVTRQTASSWCSTVRNALERPLSELYLSFARPRDEILEHRTETSSVLHNPARDKVVWIFDGTYVFIQKSGNISMQKRTYSGHKYRNLVKPMVSRI